MSVAPAPALVTPATRRFGTAVALLVTVGPAVGCWVVLARQMPGTDHGAATELGPFGPFVMLWTTMIAAMMLPAAAPAVVRYARAGGGAGGAPLVVVSFLAVWAVVG